MNISREIKKAEAIQRMKKLGIVQGAIKQFQDKDVVMISSKPLGGMAWLNAEQKEIVKNFEQQHKALVYAVILTNIKYDFLYDLLYVSDNREEWKSNNEDIEHNCIRVYTTTNGRFGCGGFSRKNIVPLNGGVVRNEQHVLYCH